MPDTAVPPTVSVVDTVKADAANAVVLAKANVKSAVAAERTGIRAAISAHPFKAVTIAVVGAFVVVIALLVIFFGIL